MSLTIDIQALRFAWPGAQDALLDIPGLTLAPGESLFLRGASGSGKSTLLNLIAGVLDGYKGSISVCGEVLEHLPGHRRDQLRANRMGLIFQQFNLLPWLSPLENVLLGCHFSQERRHRILTGGSSPEADAQRLLRELGLKELVEAPRATSTLSIGQQQRVAAARALIGNPPLIIADEPTSALDTDHRDRFIELLLDECRKGGSSLLFVSHDRTLAGHFNREISLDSLKVSPEEHL